MDDDAKVAPSKYPLSAIRSQTWSGSIPVTLSLAPSSLSSPSMPAPLHRMVSRMTYLHVGLREDILRMYKYAPALTILRGIANTSLTSTDAAIDNNNSLNSSNDKNDGTETKTSGEPEGKETTTNTPIKSNDIQAKNTDDPFSHSDHEDIPICWFEDEVTGIALRWHVFAGVLFDLLKHRHQQHKQQFHTQTNHPDDLPNLLPWRISIHFTKYPSHILSLEQYVTPPPSKNNSTTVDFYIPQTVPILKIIQQAFSNSLKQSLFLQHGSSKVAMNMSKNSHVKIWNAIMGNKYEDFWEVSADLMQTNICDNDGSGGTDEKKLVHIPVRLMVDGKPHIQRPCKLDAIEEKFTLGKLFSDWLPSTFSAMCVQETPESAMSTKYCISRSNVKWDVQGIQPPLSTPVVDLWLTLCYPDHFLYITVTALT